MDQEVKQIKISDLVLWTENPRDMIDKNATDQEIVNLALTDRRSKWTLSKLAKEMGPYYDYSELPTVVYHGSKPVVYDGNRRMILAKIKHGLVSIGDIKDIVLPDIPEVISCNVCKEKIALQNIQRKHIDSGSWDPLERDIFLNKFMNEPKSSFLILEEETNIISANPDLNKRFVKEEIFKEETLNSLGFQTSKGKLYSVHTDEEAMQILKDIAKKVENKTITTRINRGQVLEILDSASRNLIDLNKLKPTHLSKVTFKIETTTSNRQSKRTQKKNSELFGGKLYLKYGEVSNLYRDITDLYQFYLDKKESLSISFSSLIRMSLRLLCETAAKEKKKKLDKYLKDNFENAKKALDQDMKTTLSTQNITESSIIQLLHTGAHNYQSSNNLDQTLAISIIIGEILNITHGKKEESK